MKKYLVTGASGFIGGHLVRHLIKDGVNPARIRVLVTSCEQLQDPINNLSDVVVGDIRNNNDVRKAVKGVDVIYHLAAITGDGRKNLEHLRETNINGTRYLVEEAIKNGVGKLIFFSSAAIYGREAKNFNESCVKRSSDFYGMSKYEAENIIIQASRESNLKYLIFRPVHVYGPYDRGGMSKVINAIKGRYYFRIGNGKNRIDYIYVKDLVRIARSLEKSGYVNEDYIVGPKKHLTQKKMIKIISNEMLLNSASLMIPKRMALLGSYLMEFLSKIMGVSLPITSAYVMTVTSDFYFDTEKLDETGFKPEYSFKEGIKETVKSIFDN